MTIVESVVELVLYSSEVLLQDVIGIGESDKSDGSTPKDLSDIDGLLLVYQRQLEDELGVTTVDEFVSCSPSEIADVLDVQEQRVKEWMAACQSQD